MFKSRNSLVACGQSVEEHSDSTKGCEELRKSNQELAKKGEYY